MSNSDKKVSISVGKRLYDDIKEFCQLNDIKVSDWIDEKLRTSLNDDKWGDAPFYRKEPKKEKQPIKEYSSNNVINIVQTEKTSSEKPVTDATKNEYVKPVENEQQIEVVKPKKETRRKLK